MTYWYLGEKQVSKLNIVQTCKTSSNYNIFVQNKFMKMNIPIYYDISTNMLSIKLYARLYGKDLEWTKIKLTMRDGNLKFRLPSKKFPSRLPIQLRLYLAPYDEDLMKLDLFSDNIYLSESPKDFPCSPKNKSRDPLYYLRNHLNFRISS